MPTSRLRAPILDDIDSVDGAHYENIDIVNSQRSPPDGLNSQDGGFIERPAYPNPPNPCSTHAISDTNGHSALPGNSKPKKSTNEARESPVAHNPSYGWKRTQEAPIERVVFLLEAFLPMIVGCLNVMDIIPYLLFIEDTETFRQKHRESPREAVTYLIQQLKESDEPGKWQAFLEALRSTGYQYIARLLLEETEADHTINRGLLRLFTPELINRIDPEEFIDHLWADEVITDKDKEEIQCEKRNRDDIAASLMLLESIPKRQEHWFEIFDRVLEKCGLEDLINCFREPDKSIENNNEWTSHHKSKSKPDIDFMNYNQLSWTLHHQSKSKPDTDYMNYNQLSWISHHKTKSKPDTDFTYYIPPSYEYIPSKLKIIDKSEETGQAVPNMHEQQAILDQLRTKHEAWRIAVETKKEMCNLEAGIRGFELEWQNLMKGDEKGCIEHDIPKEQQTCDPTTLSLSRSKSTTLSETNADIVFTADSYAQASVARIENRQGKIVNGVLLKDIPCELKGKNEQYVIPAYVELKYQPDTEKCDRVSYLGSMDTAKSMRDISSDTEQYV